MSRFIFFTMMFLLQFSPLWSQTSSEDSGVPLRDRGFDRNQLLRDTTREEEHFSVDQSYTVRYFQSRLLTQMEGVYLTTLRYQFDIPLELSADIGVANVFYRDADKRIPLGDKDQSPDAQLLLPRIGLEFRPTPHTSFSLELFHLPDAARAYGPWGYWNDGYYRYGPYRRYETRR